MTEKRQHFVPRMHLKHFIGTNPQGHVWTYDGQTGAARSAIPKETAVESHFYSFLNIDGIMDTRVEQHLRDVESKASAIYADLVQNKDVPGRTQERADFANFLALMHVRTPAVRRMTAELVSQCHQVRSYVCATDDRMFGRFIADFQKSKGPLTEEQVSHIRDAMIDPSKYIIHVPKEMTFHCLAVADRLTPMFYDMNWCLVTPSHGFFITTDNPVVLMVDPRSGGGRFYNKTAVVMFPLSPHLLLRLSREEVPRRLIVERDHVKHLNRALAAHSERYLYAHVQDKRLERLAAEFKDKRPAIAVATSRGLRPEKFAETQVRRRSTRS